MLSPCCCCCLYNSSPGSIDKRLLLAFPTASLWLLPCSLSNQGLPASARSLGYRPCSSMTTTGTPTRAATRGRKRRRLGLQCQVGRDSFLKGLMPILFMVTNSDCYLWQQRPQTVHIPLIRSSPAPRNWKSKQMKGVLCPYVCRREIEAEEDSETCPKHPRSLCQSWELNPALLSASPVPELRKSYSRLIVTDGDLFLVL